MTLVESLPAEPVATRATLALADRRWAANVAANGHALAATQPGLVRVLRDGLPGFTPVFARDGSLTTFYDRETWWAGCSLPRRAAGAMLKRLDARGGTSCFLCPPHAAHLRVALDRAERNQAVIAVVPADRDLAVMLGCENFSADLAAGRLWFAAGEDWPAVLGRLLADRDGLPMPQQFIRLPTLPDEEVQHLVKSAQQVFAAENARRAAATASLRDGWSPATNGARRRVCVVAPSHFRLWNDAGQVIADALAASAGNAPAAEWRTFDVDDPAQASPLALARAAVASGAVVSANLARADLPNLLPTDLPWLTWVTTPRVPPFAPAAGPRDALLLADSTWRAAAREAGWPDERIGAAAWPAAPDTNADAGSSLAAVVCDTHSVEPDERIADFSSHQLLWDAIAEELRRDPFALVRAGDADRFLDTHLRRAGVAAEGLDRRAFVDRLIVPAYAQAVALTLARAGVPLRLYGRGWDALPELAPYHDGPISSRFELLQVARRAGALVHVWPSTHARPIESLGRPVLRPGPAGRDAFLRDVRAALAGHVRPPHPTAEAISAAAVLRLLRVCGVPWA